MKPERRKARNLALSNLLILNNIKTYENKEAARDQLTYTRQLYLVFCLSCLLLPSLGYHSIKFNSFFHYFVHKLVEVYM